MSARGTPDNRIRALENSVSNLKAERINSAAREAHALQIRKGVWYGELTTALSAGGAATVAIHYWSITLSAWQDSGQTVEAQDWFMAAGAEDLPIGTKVRIEWNHTRWVVMQAASATIVGFQLTANLTLGGSAAAVTVVGGTATANAITVFDVYTPRGMWTGKTGYQGIAVLHPDDNTKADIIWMARLANWIDFTLTEDMGYTTAGQASATVTAYSDQGQNPGSTVTVFDDDGMWPKALAGAKGRAKYNDFEDRYEIVTVQQQVLRGTAILGANLCGGSSVTISTFVGTTFSIFNQAPDPLPTTAHNPRGHGGISGDAVCVEWNHATSQWEIYDVQKHSITVVDAGTIRLKTGGLYLEGQTVAIYVERCAAAEYADLISLTESTVVTNVSADSDSIDQTKRKVRGFGDDATDVGSTVVSIESCPTE